MKVERCVWNQDSGWQEPIDPLKNRQSAGLVLAFAAPALLKDPAPLAHIQSRFPQALICGCSTAGEISGLRVMDDSFTASAIAFDSTTVTCVDAAIDVASQSFAVGKSLAEQLPRSGLVHTLVFSDGLRVNGAQLAAGIASGLPPGVAVTGGLSGDGDRFKETLVISKGQAKTGQVVLVGLYGANLRVGFGSMGGWDSFGPERRITKARDNVLYELDGCSALDLYKEYLGEHAAKLPASGLLFPLTVRRERSEETLVRTILAVDESAHSLTFAGDVPEGAFARLMRANFDRLVDGATGAAQKSRHKLGLKTQFALLVSCVGRKLVLGPRIEEEVETVADVLGTDCTGGFYSYGEISPAAPNASCQLHNQTMTITTLSEV
jgi:hypothetical protein